MDAQSITTLVVSIVTLIGTIVTVIVSENKNTLKLHDALELQHEKTKNELRENQIEIKASFEKSQAITETKLDNLTNEVNKHNNFATRIPIIETKLVEYEGRIEKLEAKG